MSTFKSVNWKHTTNIYEVNIRQYTPQGTFNAFAQELPRLKEMAVETLWLMPITPIAKQKMKGSLGSYYACADYTAVNPEFGKMDDFKSLVATAHRLGFNVIIDWVANHTGWGHVWTISNPDYYKRDASTGAFKAASGMEDIIELDYTNPALRQAMIKAMQFWVAETGIDGFRCDLASWVPVDFWEEARLRLDAGGRPLFWLGEFDELENPEYGSVFDASYTWRWMHKTEEFYKNQLPLDELKKLLYQYDSIGDKSMRAWFTSNHDENSWNGTEYEKYGELVKLLAVFCCTWNGIPLIYSGQEIPLKNKRLLFFDKDAIPWDGKYELAGFYKKLFLLHSRHPALRGGDTSVTTYMLSTSADDKVLAYLRRNGHAEVCVFLNFSGHSISALKVHDSQAAGKFTEIFSGMEWDPGTGLEMPPYSYCVFEKIS